MNTQTSNPKSTDSSTNNTLALVATYKANAQAGLQKFSADCVALWKKLTARVTNDLANEYGVATPVVQQAVSEAQSLAAATGFPTLLFPALAEEKVRNAFGWASSERNNREIAFAV